MIIVASVSNHFSSLTPLTIFLKPKNIYGWKYLNWCVRSSIQTQTTTCVISEASTRLAKSLSHSHTVRQRAQVTVLMNLCWSFQIYRAPVSQSHTERQRVQVIVLLYCYWVPLSHYFAPMPPPYKEHRETTTDSDILLSVPLHNYRHHHIPCWASPQRKAKPHSET